MKPQVISEFHIEKLEIKEGVLYLDGKKVMNVEGFELKTLTPHVVEITIKKIVKLI